VDALTLLIQKFINTHRSSEGPIIVGFSGGPDSTALVRLLQAAGVENFHLAHFDHGWRDQSAKEAESLKEKATSWNLPFWTERAEGLVAKENEARRARYAFFKRLYEQLDASAILLAHQKEDLAETVLKRVFEGAHLASLQGMEPVAERMGMQVWRPLLALPKKELMSYLEREEEDWLEDPTNRDSRYLRGKMRGGLMADLSKAFGKEIVAPLTRLSLRAIELEAYLSRKATFIQDVSGPFGTYWELPKERIEARYLLRQILKKRGLTWTHTELEKALGLLHEKAANCQLAGTFFADRGLLFSIERSKDHVDIEATLTKSPPSYHCDWRSAWRGQAWVGLTNENYTFLPPEQGRFSKFWGNHKVPVCVRSLFPLIVHGENEISEFLSGKNRVLECTFPIYLQLKVKSRHPISDSAGVV